MKRKTIFLFVLILAVIFSFIFLQGCSHLKETPPNPWEQVEYNNGTYSYGSGELKYTNDIPFLRVQGSYYDMGKQYGALLKERLDAIIADIEPIKTNALAQLGMSLELLAQQLEPILPGCYKDELRGISDGSGISYEEILVYSFTAELISFIACSAILYKVGSRLLHTRNLDYGYPQILGKYPVIVEYNGEGILSFTSISIIGYAPVLSGINEKGISVTLNSGPGNNLSSTSLTGPYKARQILENAVNISDVDNLLEDFTTGIGWIFTVGSTNETNGIIYDVAVNGNRRNSLGKDSYLFVTNDFLSSDLRNGDLMDCKRYAAISDHMKNDIITGVDDLIAVLRDRSLTGMGGINNGWTLHSMVFDFSNFKIYFAFAQGYAADEGTFYTFNLNDTSITAK
jgi:hypothetical protein